MINVYDFINLHELFLKVKSSREICELSRPHPKYATVFYTILCSFSLDSRYIIIFIFYKHKTQQFKTNLAIDTKSRKKHENKNYDNFFTKWEIFLIPGFFLPSILFSPTATRRREKFLFHIKTFQMIKNNFALKAFLLTTKRKNDWKPLTKERRRNFIFLSLTIEKFKSGDEHRRNRTLRSEKI